MHYQFYCALKLAGKYEIEHWSLPSKTVNWSADNFQINHVTSMSWHRSLRYGHVILLSGYPVLTAVNWPFCECAIIQDVDLPRHAWDALSSLLIVSPTPPLQSVDACAPSIPWQPNEKRLTIFYEYGALSHARFARMSPAIEMIMYITQSKKEDNIAWEDNMQIM